MNDDISKYLENLFRVDNPVIVAFFTVVFISFLVHLFFTKIYFPAKRQFENEKQTLEAKHNKVMALFAELDPHPLIRIAPDGEVIKFNDAAKKLFPLIKEKFNISLILPIEELNVKAKIDSDSTFEFNTLIECKYFSIIFRGISYLGFAQLYFTDLTERKLFEDKLAESEKRYRDLSFYLEEQIELEKQRIGRELHDSINQNLILLRILMNESVEPDKYLKNFTELNRVLDSAIKDLKEIVFNLQPRVISELGLPPALQNLIDMINKVSDIKGELSLSGEMKKLETKIELSIYRIVQEGLNNIIKHSNANEFHIQLSYLPSSLRIMITDNGVGFNPFDEKKPLSGNGLFNINERIQKLNGKVEFKTAVDEGTIINMDIPIC
jgi:signal transduction histidine kinase